MEVYTKGIIYTLFVPKVKYYNNDFQENESFYVEKENVLLFGLFYIEFDIQAQNISKR